MESRSQHQNHKSRTLLSPENALRCGCGNLLARVVAQGVEIKCRRCKRHVVVPLDAKEPVRINM